MNGWSQSDSIANSNFSMRVVSSAKRLTRGTPMSYWLATWEIRPAGL
jgi:hypothetical protein